MPGQDVAGVEEDTNLWIGGPARSCRKGILSPTYNELYGNTGVVSELGIPILR